MKKYFAIFFLLILTGCVKNETKPLSGLTFPTTFQSLVWEKPTTDEAWANDVKKESFDIKSTNKLQEMIIVHTEKLKKIEADKEIVDCPECFKYKLRKQLENDYSDKELEKLIESEYQQALAKHKWDIEKLNQSLERMSKELELRANGFVEIKEKGKDLEKNLPPDRVRNIND